MPFALAPFGSLWAKSLLVQAWRLAAPALSATRWPLGRSPRAVWMAWEGWLTLA